MDIGRVLIAIGLAGLAGTAIYHIHKTRTGVGDLQEICLRLGGKPFMFDEGSDRPYGLPLRLNNGLPLTGRTFMCTGMAQLKPSLQ
jgi:hypothetical protein